MCRKYIIYDVAGVSQPLVFGLQTHAAIFVIFTGGKVRAKFPLIVTGLYYCEGL